MTNALIRLLAFTRHGAGSTGPFCVQCLDADLRAELGSLSHAEDVQRLRERGGQN